MRDSLRQGAGSCLTRVKMTRLLQINKYKADFAEFTVAWVISVNVNHAESVKNSKLVDSMNFGNFTTGYTEP